MFYTEPLKNLKKHTLKFLHSSPIFVLRGMKVLLGSVFFSSFFSPLFAAENPNLNPVLKFFKLGQSEYTTLNPANQLGKEVLDLYSLFAWVGIGVFCVVALIFIVVVYRFRETKHPKAKDLRGNFLLEMFWTTVPIVILIVIAIPTIQIIFKIAEVPVSSSDGFSLASGKQKIYPEYLEVNVIGHQWWWEFEYIAIHKWQADQNKDTVQSLHRVTSSEAYFPVGVPVKVNLVSEDVIHSFWLPRVMGKTDAMPGQVNQSTLVFETAGLYKGECALYCGASHALMRFNVVVVDQKTFQDWLNWGSGDMVLTTESAKRGAVVAQTCVACHTMKGVKDYVPRSERLEQAKIAYEENVKLYEAGEKAYKEKMAQENKKVWERQMREDPSMPAIPVKPSQFGGELATIGPDLTDIQFKKFVVSGIKQNTRENLINWIKNPPSIKPEISGTLTVRMPAYEHVLDNQSIEDVVEFLSTVKYSKSDFVAPVLIPLYPTPNQK